MKRADTAGQSQQDHPHGLKAYTEGASACGGALVDLDTPKSEELTAQYDFYPDAMNTIRRI